MRDSIEQGGLYTGDNKGDVNGNAIPPKTTGLESHQQSERDEDPTYIANTGTSIDGASMWGLDLPEATGQ